MKKLRDADLKGKRVLMRVDFNIPMDKSGNIIDDTKMKEALPTIRYVLDNGASIVLMSHLGRPNGKPDEKYSLKPIASHLQGLLSRPVTMAPDCIGTRVEAMVQKLQPGQILVLENVRFHTEEEKNDSGFSRQLAAWGEIFVNDAFGTAHRAHSSTAGVADYLPTYAGFLMEKEVEMLRDVLENPESPRMAILGGAKTADKLGLIHNLLGKMDFILIGGGMANTFLKAQGKQTGKSLVEDNLLGEAGRLLATADAARTRILLPVDAVVAAELSPEAIGTVVDVNKVPADMMILDIGPRTIELFTQTIMMAKTVVWNGPLGVYEYEQFARGTRKVAEALSHSQAISVIGGGDSAAAVHDMGLEKNITHISTGGGATLEFLEGLQLPGVAACEGYASALH